MRIGVKMYVPSGRVTRVSVKVWPSCVSVTLAPGDDAARRILDGAEDRSGVHLGEGRRAARTGRHGDDGESTPGRARMPNPPLPRRHACAAAERRLRRGDPYGYLLGYVGVNHLTAGALVVKRFFVVAVAVSLAGRRRRPRRARFVDAAPGAGLTARDGDRRASGPRSTSWRRPGAASRSLDYDGDGWLDVFLVNGARRGERGGAEPPLPQPRRRHVRRRDRPARASTAGAGARAPARATTTTTAAWTCS